jgi:hypothetical protein
MADLRAYGARNGTPPFEQRDRSRYLQALELAVRARTATDSAATNSGYPPSIGPPESQG